MAKKNFNLKNLNIVTVFTWFSNVLDTCDLSASEQLVLLHVIKFLNRNFWQPISLSNHKLAYALGKDDRTVKMAIKKLVKRKLLILKGGAIHVGIEGVEGYFTEGGGGNISENESFTSHNAEFATEGESKVKTLADFY